MVAVEYFGYTDKKGKSRIGRRELDKHYKPIEPKRFRVIFSSGKAEIRFGNTIDEIVEQIKEETGTDTNIESVSFFGKKQKLKEVI